MKVQEELVVTDWFKDKPKNGSFFKLTLNSDQRRILRGKKISDCGKEVILQLPRAGILKDGDILLTNKDNIFIKIIAKKENLIEISSDSKHELIKIAYHLGNRHVEVEIYKNVLLTKSDYVIERMLKNFNVDLLNICKEFYPEIGAHNHE